MVKGPICNVAFEGEAWERIGHHGLCYLHLRLRKMGKIPGVLAKMYCKLIWETTKKKTSGR